MHDNDAVLARYRELCSGDPNEVIDELLGLLEKEDGTFPWHAVYMHKLQLEQAGRAPYAMGFEKHITWMVSKAQGAFPRLQREQPELEAEAERLAELQKQRPITEEELLTFVTRFKPEELSVVGF